MSGSHIQVSQLKKRYAARTVVDDVSFTLEKGAIVGLLGPNGAGKTTTFYMIVGLVTSDAGSVRLGDVEMSGLSMYQRARMGIGYLPQETSIFRKLSVEENLTVIWEARKILPRSQFKSEAKKILEEMGIYHLRESKGYELSGGEKRRVEIARALAINPTFLLLDEPFAGVDPIAVSEIQDIIKSLKERGLGIVISDHNVRETLAITDEAHILHEGKLLVSGKSEDIIRDKNAQQYYFGQGFDL